MLVNISESSSCTLNEEGLVPRRAAAPARHFVLTPPRLLRGSKPLQQFAPRFAATA